MNEWHDIIEHYAYRTSQSCVKLDAICQMVGGFYDHHSAVTYKTAKYIFDRFLRHSKRIQSNKYKNVKVENMHCFDHEEADGSKAYRIHIYNRNCTETRRKAMWIKAGILMKLPNDLAYAKVFYMPCKSCTNFFTERKFFLYHLNE